MNVFQKIIETLDKEKVDYEIKEHPPTPTSEDSAKHRKEPLSIGAKALILKSNDVYIMCVVPGNKKLDSRKVKDILKIKKLKFATTEEVKLVSHCVPGSIPPFGNLFGIKVLMDKSFQDNENIAFNAGLLTKSIKMKEIDYRRIVNPIVDDISRIDLL